MHKRYPVGTPNQTYLQGLFHLLEANHVTPQQIKEIEIHMPKRSVHRVPATRHASISALKVSAIAANTGKLDFYQLHDPEAAADKASTPMQERIRFVGREDWTGMDQGRHAIVIIRTNDGRTLEEEVWHKPMTRTELERKFTDLVVPKFGRDKAAQLQSLLQGLETAASVRPLMEKLRA
jgi:2-methylcitrate dehydratase PrpD